MHRASVYRFLIPPFLSQLPYPFANIIHNNIHYYNNNNQPNSNDYYITDHDAALAVDTHLPILNDTSANAVSILENGEYWCRCLILILLIFKDTSNVNRLATKVKYAAFTETRNRKI